MYASDDALSAEALAEMLSELAVLKALTSRFAETSFSQQSESNPQVKPLMDVEATLDAIGRPVRKDAFVAWAKSEAALDLIRVAFEQVEAKRSADEPLAHCPARRLQSNRRHLSPSFLRSAPLSFGSSRRA